MIGIEFNGKHSYKDLGLTITPDRIIGRPSKEKKKRKPTYSNTEHDFSRLYGSETYRNRLLTYSFNVLEKSKVNLSYKMIEVVDWLMNSDGRKPLIDEGIPGYYFMAEVENETDIDENWTDGIITVSFVAYPFMRKEKPEGSPYWDDYTILDIYQETSFDISGSKTITLVNNGSATVRPEITASSQMSITKGQRTFMAPEGTSESYQLTLATGETTLTVEGNGSISFEWHKEVL
ncbi:Phage tail protein [Alkalibacterium putridalgicola]|uniref:Phage tail protein n=1 Tax=Alkalibacterium putridalgicola TaxID=426703 RepID=A0A1H7RK90_9LACT|nr:hypothetical protein [Alkalibacterium putridalgicola]GEK88879.1 hypothetical protein APU01nite_09180 [Alkalibacterium putridalgicola]SEL60525.1 Phage tail protein [Alkalibacterium putridalgicola]